MKLAAPLLALTLCSCAEASKTERALQSAIDFIPVADQMLREMYRVAQEQCLELKTDAERRQCVTKVRHDWQRVKDGVLALRDTWCQAVPDQCDDVDQYLPRMVDAK